MDLTDAKLIFVDSVESHVLLRNFRVGLFGEKLLKLISKTLPCTSGCRGTVVCLPNFIHVRCVQTGQSFYE